MENEEELLRKEKSKIDRGDLERRVYALERAIGILQDRFDNLQSKVSGLSEELEKGDTKREWTSEELKNLFQKWFDENEFEIQPHSHIDDKSGGDAFARLGGNLI